MSSPRKFSEKIALHNQKQAEETAAFEQIMKEVSIVSRHPHSHTHHHDHLQLVPALGAYRGGSLPNVNQLGNNASIDLQQALHSLEDIKNATGRGVQDRVYRTQRSGAHRGRHEAAPYSAPYLSPPSDTSWRRTNSDSALHTSAMVPDVFSGSPSVPPHRRDMMDNNSSMGERLKPLPWDPKKGQQQLQSRPRSCEVPGINICPSEQPDANPIPISSNTGSLPDLTNLHIPSPLPTPLDPEDQTYNHSGSNTNLSQSMPSGHLGVMGNHSLPQVTTHSPQVSPQMSPQAGRRQVMSNPGSPVVLNQQRRHLTPSPQGIPLDQTPSIVVDHHQDTPNHHTQQQVAQQQQQQQQQQQLVNQGNIFQHQQHAQQHSQQSPQQQAQQQGQQQQHHHSNPQSPQHNVPPSLTLDMSQMAALQAQMQHYRDKQMMGSNVSCSSPTSPVSNPNNSPLPSPGGGAVPLGSPGSVSPVHVGMSPSLFNDAYYQQQQQQQTNALQYKFEQFNMMQGSEGKQKTTSTPTSPTFVVTQHEHDIQAGLGLSYGAVYSHNLGGSQELIHQGRPPPSYQQTLMQIPQHSHPSNIPDIIFTGAGESPPRQQELAREISNAMASVDSNFEHDLLFSTDSLNVDPLDLEHLQMLSDNDIVADQATEDSFRQDHRL
ncbi:CREB-regulated transcription coactivator 1-like [Diadema antillarum]|uniref:CREB-regulated transcription coactivator 1-like n=2 Tax=Diadema antillarum TaxID=105358 RepID=UPI003A8C5349